MPKPRVLPAWLGPEWELSMQVCWQAHRLAVLTIAFAQHAGGQKSRSADLHNDVAHMSQCNVQLVAYSSTILLADVLEPGGMRGCLSICR